MDLAAPWVEEGAPWVEEEGELEGHSGSNKHLGCVKIHSGDL